MKPVERLGNRNEELLAGYYNKVGVWNILIEIFAIATAFYSLEILIGVEQVGPPEPGMRYRFIISLLASNAVLRNIVFGLAFLMFGFASWIVGKSIIRGILKKPEVAIYPSRVEFYVQRRTPVVIPYDEILGVVAGEITEGGGKHASTCLAIFFKFRDMAVIEQLNQEIDFQELTYGRHQNSHTVFIEELNQEIDLRELTSYGDHDYHCYDYHYRISGLNKAPEIVAASVMDAFSASRLLSH